MKNYVSNDGYYGTLDRNNKFYPVGADVKGSKIEKVIEDNSILVSLEFVVGGEPQVIRCKFNDLQQELNRAGYPIANSQMASLVDYIQQQMAEVKTTNIHKSIGWCGYGNYLVFKGQKAVGITSSYAGNFNIKPHGKLADFRKDYKEVVFGSIPLEASMIMGLSACMVGYLSRVSDIPVPTLIFDIYGKSTTGKTTSAKLAVSMGGSVQSCSDKVSLSATCSTTANALYGILNDNFGYPMLFDETGRFGKLHNYMEMIYALADGTDKARMTKNGTISTVKHWATSVLFTGEAPMLDKADKADGLIVRVIPLSNVNWTENRSQAHLVEAFSKNYAGLPIQKLAKYICSQSSEEILALYKSDIELLIDDIPVEAEFKERIAKSAALLLLTAQLAEEALRIKFHKDDIIEFFLNNIGDNSPTNEAKKAFEYIVNKYYENLGKFVKKDDTENNIFMNTRKDCFGLVWHNYSRKSFDNGKEIDLLIIVKHIFLGWLEKGGFSNINNILREWRENGIICWQKKDQYYSQQRLKKEEPYTMCIRLVLNNDTYSVKSANKKAGGLK